MKLINRLICLIKGHWYYDCICARCGKHMGDNPIKRFFKRIICLVKGHKWEKRWRRKYIDPFELDDSLPLDYSVIQCARCGKILKDVP